MTSIPDEIRRLGTVFGTTDQAEKTATEFEKGLQEADASDKPAGSVAWVYYFGATDPVSAYGNGIPDDILTRSGLTNVFQGPKPYITTNMEALLDKNPDWIVLSYGKYGETEEEAA